MYDTQYTSAHELRSKLRLRRNLLMALLTAVLTLIFGVMVGLSYFMPKIQSALILTIGVLMVTSLIVPVIIWHNPRAGLFMLFAATTLLDNDPRVANAQKLTANVPFFLNLNNIGDVFHIAGLQPFKFSPAEFIITLTLLSWLIRGIARRDLHVQRGPFLGCLLFYAATTIMGYIHGYATGGDLTMALWEVRAQFYPIIMYFLVMQLITERKHVEQMLWIAFIGLGLLSLVGLVSFFQLGGNVSDQGLLDHEDSLILNVFVFLLMFLRLNNGNRKMVRVGYLFLPTVIFTLMENQRRAGIAAFVIAFIAALPIMWVLFERHRVKIAKFIVVFTVISAVYLPAAWNGKGAWALPGRAIRSNFSPDDRDAGSDNYRMMENSDLKYTRDASPIFGFGYGKPYYQPWYLPEQGFNVLMQYLAHNSVLWVWMRTGHIGFFAFLLFIAVVFIKGMQISRSLKDVPLQTAALMGVIFLLMAFVYGKYDLQLSNNRTMMMMGVWVGLLGVAPLLEASSEQKAKEKPLREEYPMMDMPGLLEGDIL